VRRWTAPASGRVDLSGTIAKNQDCGDGLRAWVASSEQGFLGAWTVDFGESKPAQIDAIEVKAGETLDFVVDCGEAGNFSCDGFDWAPVLRSADGEGSWDAREHFGGEERRSEPLGNWERLAQALLISNEAMFLD
jgi:hypothetical protein